MNSPKTCKYRTVAKEGWGVSWREEHLLPQRVMSLSETFETHEQHVLWQIKPQWVSLSSAIKSYKEIYVKKYQFLLF